MRLVKLLILIGLLFGCSENQFTPLSSSAVIVAFGDSLTFGVGAKAAESYPNQLEKLLDLKVINAGISGETTQQGLVRFSQVLQQSGAELVILLEGGNDILRNLPHQQIESNLDAMIEIAHSQGVQILLIGVPEKALFSNSADFYRALAKRHELVFDGEILSTLLHDRQYKSDPIHLNAKGYQKLAERIFELLKSEGALIQFE